MTCLRQELDFCLPHAALQRSLCWPARPWGKWNWKVIILWSLEHKNINLSNVDICWFEKYFQKERSFSIQIENCSQQLPFVLPLNVPACSPFWFENTQKETECRVRIKITMQPAVNNYISSLTNLNFINFTETHGAHLKIDVTLLSSILAHCIISHRGWLIRCFGSVCPHVPTVHGDDDRCFKWHFSVNNLLSYWFSTQISCSVVFQRMDFVPCCFSFHPSSFLPIENFNISFQGFFIALFLCSIYSISAHRISSGLH